MKTLSEYHDIIIHLEKDIQQQYQEFLRNPNDIETIHALRVSIRQLRSLISFIKPLLGKETYQDIQAHLRKLHQTSADLRNLDVLMVELNSFQEQNSVMRNCIALSTLLSEEREQHKNAVMATDFQSPFNKVSTMINLTLASTQSENFQKFVDNRLSKWSRSLIKLAKSINESSSEGIHALRIKYKKLRYVQTLLESEVMDLKQLKKSQDILGEINDTYGAMTLLDAYSSHSQDESLNNEISIFKGYYLLKRDLLFKEKLTINC